LIKIEKGLRLVVLLSYKKKLLKRYKNKHKEKIYNQIICDSNITYLEHAAYLGLELAKARSALKNGHDYIQDSEPQDNTQSDN
jgi:tetrahydromethanopterin S-methyltransferase subunit A